MNVILGWDKLVNSSPVNAVNTYRCSIPTWDELVRAELPEFARSITQRFFGIAILGLLREDLSKHVFAEAAVEGFAKDGCSCKHWSLGVLQDSNDVVEG